MNNYWRTALCNIAATVGLLLTANSWAADAPATSQGQVAPTSPIAGAAIPQTTTSQTASNSDVEQLLQHVSRAQLMLHLGDKATADQHIHTALQIASSIENAPSEQRTHLNVHTGIIAYLTGTTKSEYMVPLLENTDIVKTYTTGPFWSEKKGLAVKDVTAVNVSITIDPSKATADLQKASDYLNKDKFADASSALSKFQRSIVVEEKSVHLPMQQASENLMLAEFMVQRNFFDGARFALKHADEALNNIKLSNNDQKENVQSMRSEIKQLSQTLAKKDPTVTEKAMAQIKQWQDKLNSWSNANASQ